MSIKSMQVNRTRDCKFKRLAMRCSVFLNTTGGCEDCAQNKKLDSKKMNHRKGVHNLEKAKTRNQLTRALNKWNKNRFIQILFDGYFIDVLTKSEFLPFKSKYRDIAVLDKCYFNEYGMTIRHKKLLEEYFNHPVPKA